MSNSETNKLFENNLELSQVRAIFEQAAARYDQYAVLEREVADRLLERIEFQRREPLRIIDLGCGSGYCAEALKRRYRKAEVIAVDFALPMCRLAAARSAFLRPLRAVCAEVSSLPFASRSADLVVANLALHWAEDLPRLFNGLRLILRPGGLLLFSIPGTDSLKEMKIASNKAGLSNAIREFRDMHDIGDALLAAGFREPVMDAETITVSYRNYANLLEELQATGASSYFHDWDEMLRVSPKLEASHQKSSGETTWPLGWEMVYGAA